MRKAVRGRAAREQRIAQVLAYIDQHGSAVDSTTMAAALGIPNSTIHGLCSGMCKAGKLGSFQKGRRVLFGRPDMMPKQAELAFDRVRGSIDRIVKLQRLISWLARVAAGEATTADQETLVDWLGKTLDKSGAEGSAS